MVRTRTSNSWIKLGTGVAMVEDAKSSRSQKSVVRSDPDVDLLQRSIDHVEHLLSQLEFGAGPGQQDNPHQQNGPSTARSTAANARPTVAVGTEPTAQVQVDGAKASPDTGPSAVQADALRIKLHAYDEADRIRARAAEAHAQAVTDSERLLVEAERICEQLRADAISETAARAQELRAYAQSAVDAIKRDFRTWVSSAVGTVAAEADTVPLLAHDTFAGLVERFTEVLSCLQELATAMGPHATLATAFTERSLHPRSPDEDAPMAGPDPSARGDLAAGNASAEAPDGSGVSMIDGEAPHALFRTARR